METGSGLARAMEKALGAAPYAVDVSRDVREALELAVETPYDVIVLDLPIRRLAEALKRFRESGVRAPILALSEYGGASDRIQTLEAGADDCVAKPFSLEELVVRVRVLTRRAATPVDMLCLADLELDRLRRKVMRQGKQIQLTPKEYAVLEYLMENAGRPVTRSMVIEHVWNANFEGLTNVVDVYINHLRAKVDHDFNPKLIRTERGVGYMLMDPQRGSSDAPQSLPSLGPRPTRSGAPPLGRSEPKPLWPPRANRVCRAGARNGLSAG